MACPTICSPAPFNMANGIVPPNVQTVEAASEICWCDMIQLANNIIAFIFNISVILAVIFVIYGGFVFLTAAGNSSKIKKGQTIIKSALIGVAIVFGVSIIIRTIFVGLGVSVSLLPW